MRVSRSSRSARWSLPAVIEEHAANRGANRFASIVGGASLTYAELRDDAAKVATMLAELGVEAGDRVAIMLPNSLDFIRAWSGVGRLGAVAVLLNTELSGAFLAHPLADSAPRLLIIDAAYLPRLDDLSGGVPARDQIIVVGDGAELYRPFDAYRAAAIIETPMPRPADIACIMYTSGTTGRAEGRVDAARALLSSSGYGTVDNLGGRRERPLLYLPAAISCQRAAHAARRDVDCRGDSDDTGSLLSLGMAQRHSNERGDCCAWPRRDQCLHRRAAAISRRSRSSLAPLFLRAEPSRS
jgi:acyl-CoA synthetase (AMP-forming)/AMP-acid ligase II